MRDLIQNLILTCLLLSFGPTGCGTDLEVPEESIEHQLRWQQPPGEIQDCHVFKLSNPRGAEVDRIQIKFPKGSHHVHIYRSTEPEEDAVYDCFRGIDWTRWSLLIGAQTEPMDWQLPEGVTIELAPHQQLLAQVHWLNTTDEAIAPRIDLSFHTTERSRPRTAPPPPLVRARCAPARTPASRRSCSRAAARSRRARTARHGAGRIECSVSR